MKQQINTFEELFPHIDEYGVYLCEDLHTSYMRKWGGGFKISGTFIEYSKNFIDFINAWHSQHSRRLSVSGFTKSAHSLHYYDSILVIEKRPIKKPYYLKSGSPQIPRFKPSGSFVQRFKRSLKRSINFK